MQYYTDSKEIQALIAQYSQAKILWVDVEVADYQTSNPRLSLIQVLDDSNLVNSKSSLESLSQYVSILDVLDQPKLADELIAKIMRNSAIEKVFHNASYDLQFLGGKRQTKNVTCTLEMAKKIPYYLVPLPNHKLKTLAEQLCHLPPVDKSEQGGDWGRRPLTVKQLHYAKMDPVYVALVHYRLLQLTQLSESEPTTEDIAALTIRYRQLEHQWKQLDTEIAYLKDRIKTAMQAQGVSETAGFRLSSSKRSTKKVAFDQLAKVTQALDIELELPVTLTKELQKQLGEVIEQLPIEEEITDVWRLSIQQLDDEELPF